MTLQDCLDNRDIVGTLKPFADKRTSKRTMNKLLHIIALLLMSSVAIADNFIIKDIRVDGLQRISPGTVFNFLPVKVGDEMSDSDAKGIIRALFKSKYFNFYVN